MTLVLETGSGISGANSYVSLAVAAELLAEVSVTTAWANVSEPLREALLARAASIIDADFSFRGEVLLVTQGLSFPRKNLLDRDKREITGIPRMLKEANAEFAYALSQNTDIISDPGASSVDQLKVGPIELKISDSAKIKKLMPDSVIQKLSLYGSQVRTVRRSRRLSY